MNALLLAGMPPVGRGVYARGSVPEGPWSFAIVSADANATRNVAAARARGLDVHLGLYEAAFHVDNWQGSLALIVRHARELGVWRIVVDPEQMAHDRAAMSALGAALALLADDFTIGVTSVPDAPNLDALMAPLGDRAWGAPQLYGRTIAPSAFEAHLSRWRALFGPRLVVSAAGWHAGEWQKDAPTYALYLGALPRTCGVIVWYEGNGVAEGYMLAQLAAFEPGGSLPGTLALATSAFVARTWGAASVAAGALVLALVAFAAMHVGGLSA